MFLAIHANFTAGYATLCNGIDTSNLQSLSEAKQRLDDMVLIRARNTRD